jgi:hypothetical protein
MTKETKVNLKSYNLDGKVSFTGEQKPNIRVKYPVKRPAEGDVR